MGMLVTDSSPGVIYSAPALYNQTCQPNSQAIDQSGMLIEQSMVALLQNPKLTNEMAASPVGLCVPQLADVPQSQSKGRPHIIVVRISPQQRPEPTQHSVQCRTTDVRKLNPRAR